VITERRGGFPEPSYRSNRATRAPATGAPRNVKRPDRKGVPFRGETSAHEEMHAIAAASRRAAPTREDEFTSSPP
jgi:hypothetical protein